MADYRAVMNGDDIQSGHKIRAVTHDVHQIMLVAAGYIAVPEGRARNAFRFTAIGRLFGP